MSSNTVYDQQIAIGDFVDKKLFSFTFHGI